MQGSPDPSVSMATVVLPAIGEGQLVHFGERSRDAFGSSSSGIVFTESAWKEEGGRTHASISSTGMRPRNLPVPEEFLHQQQQQQQQRVTEPGATRSHSSEALSALPSRATDSSHSVSRHPLGLPLRRGRADGGRRSPSDPPSTHSDLGDPSNDSETLLLLPLPRSITISPRLSANSRESAADGGSSSARQSSGTGAPRAFFGPPRTPEEARNNSPKYRQDSNSSRHSRESHENTRTTRDRLLRREAQDLGGHLAARKKPETRRCLDDDRRMIIGGGATRQQVGGAWNGGMSNVFSKSSVNISKDRELSTSAKTHEKPRLQKFRSDIDLTSKGLYDNQYTRHLCSNAPKSNAFTTSPASIQVRPAHLSPQAVQVKGKQVLKSPSHFRPRNRKSSEEANAASNQRRPEPEMDANKTEMVLEWLQDVDGFADPPESPVIFDSGPEQSDTAIHVVYQGD